MPAQRESPVEIGSLETSNSSAASEGESYALAQHDWDPTRSYDDEASPRIVLCTSLDIAELIKDPPAGMHVAPQEDDDTKVHVLVVGPADTPYEGGFFHFLIQCPPDYPMRPPRVRLMNTDGGTVTFHPKLHKSGMVLLEILGNLFPSAWRPLLRISHVLVEIKSLLSAHPYVNVPSLSAEMWLSDAVFYYHLAQHETMRVAVCDAVEACLNGTSQCPPELRNVMMRLFLEHYDHYEAIVESNKDLSGGTMYQPYIFSLYEEGSFQYYTLLSRLPQLRLQVQECLNSSRAETN